MKTGLIAGIGIGVAVVSILVASGSPFLNELNSGFSEIALSVQDETTASVSQFTNHGTEESGEGEDEGGEEGGEGQGQGEQGQQQERVLVATYEYCYSAIHGNLDERSYIRTTCYEERFTPLNRSINNRQVAEFTFSLHGLSGEKALAIHGRDESPPSISNIYRHTI